MFKNKALRALGLLLVLTLMLIAVGGNQLIGLTKIGQTMDEHFEVAAVSHQLHLAVKEKGISLRNIVLYDDPELVRDQVDQIQRIHETVTHNIERLEELVRHTDQRLLVSDMVRINDEFSAYVRETVDSVDTGDTEKAKRLIQDSGFRLQEEIDLVSGKLVTTAESVMEERLYSEVDKIRTVMTGGSLLFLLGVIGTSIYLYRNVWLVAGRLNRISRIMREIASGKAGLETKLESGTADELGDVSDSFNMLTSTLEEQIGKEKALRDASEAEAWLRTHVADMTTALNDEQEPDSIAETFLSMTVPVIEASQAAFYLYESDDAGSGAALSLLAAYALPADARNNNAVIRPGEGLIGQAAIDKRPILLNDVPADYMRVQSGLGEARPLTLYVIPILYRNELRAVVEFASFVRYDEAQIELLNQVAGNLGIILDNATGRMRLAKLLEESQALMEELQVQSEELQTQQEELRATNEELEAQTVALKQSEEKLQAQQEELEHANGELRDKAAMLEVQNMQLEAYYMDAEKSRSELEEKAAQLEQSSKYKSEFLANMSHELRTPLNSLLILSKLMADNKEGNLSAKQVEFSRTIHSSGHDLLAKINDILDLVKIEAGKMDVHPTAIALADLAQAIEHSFRPIAQANGVAFEVTIDADAPACLHSDEQRLLQILNNLLANAFKFTSHGQVTLAIGAVQPADRPLVRFEITDTGIGIPADKQEIIFQAFQQADGTTSRKYGGTGLGLSICRELCALLGGELHVRSTEGQGSTFTLLIGDYVSAPQPDAAVSSFDETRKEAAYTAERHESTTTEQRQPPEEKAPVPILASDLTVKRLLIVDPDKEERRMLMELIGRSNVVISAVSSGEEAIEELKVNSYDCIVLDPTLSDSEDFGMLEQLTVSVHGESAALFIHTSRMLNASEEMQLRKYARVVVNKDSLSRQRLVEELDLYLKSETGGAAQRRQPMAASVQNDLLNGRKVLLVDDDVRNVFAISNVLELYGMDVIFAENGLEGVRLVRETPGIDLVLMDIMMPEMDGYEAMRRIREMPGTDRLPIIALTAKAMKEDRMLCIEAGASDYIVKPVDADQLISLIRVWLYPDHKGR